MEAHNKKNRMKIKHTKFVDTNQIHWVAWEDECGPVLVNVHRFLHIPEKKLKEKKLEADQWGFSVEQQMLLLNVFAMAKVALPLP